METIGGDTATIYSPLQGKLLAAFTAVCGVLVMALPIPIVVDNFADYYQEQKKIESQELKEEAKLEEEKWLEEQHEVYMRALMDTVVRTGPVLAPPDSATS